MQQDLVNLRYLRQSLVNNEVNVRCSAGNLTVQRGLHLGHPLPHSDAFPRTVEHAHPGGGGRDS